MELTTLIETTVGPLEIQTVTVPWIGTVLSFGLMKKAVCKISGPALERYYQVRVEAAQRWEGEFPATNSWADKIEVFYTMRVSFWHNHMVEYVQAQGRVMSWHHRCLQLNHRIEDAVENGDPQRALELLQEKQDLMLDEDED